jgi:ketosteroid isomerase-like protein
VIDPMTELQPLIDRPEIEALRGEFTDAVMMRDHDRFASLFTVDGEWRIPYIDVELSGRDVIGAGFARMQGRWDFFVQTAHAGTIELQGDTAVGRAYLCEIGRMRDGRSELNDAACHDRYERTSEGRKFSSRSYELRYLDTTPLAGTGWSTSPEDGDGTG